LPLQFPKKAPSPTPLLGIALGILAIVRVPELRPFPGATKPIIIRQEDQDDSHSKFVRLTYSSASDPFSRKGDTVTSTLIQSSLLILAKKFTWIIITTSNMSKPLL
jgi:hypothetical protein